jgi:hypothetical protein
MEEFKGLMDGSYCLFALPRIAKCEIVKFMQPFFLNIDVIGILAIVVDGHSGDG